MIATSQTCIDAIVSHDATGVRFADDVSRTENGVETGTSSFVSARFLVTQGLIRHIDVVECFAGGPVADRLSSPSPLGTSASLCLRPGPSTG